MFEDIEKLDRMVEYDLSLEYFTFNDIIDENTPNANLDDDELSF